MALALDRELADFFASRSSRWASPIPGLLSPPTLHFTLSASAKKLRIPAANLDAKKLEAQINSGSYGEIFAQPCRFLHVTRLPARMAELDASRRPCEVA